MATFQLATAQESHNSNPSLGVFYTATLYDIDIPAGTQHLTISGSSDGTADTSVDDQITITMSIPSGATATYTYDYSNNNQGWITPIAPFDLTQQTGFSQFIGQTVTITTTFTDLFQNYHGGSAIWLVTT